MSFFILLLVATSAAADERTESLRRAAEYLWKQQAEDGGWHSPQYGLLRSGQALTPFVLDALLDVPEAVCPRPAGGVRRGLDFIRQHVDKDGALGHSDPDIVEYPVYSTSYALKCLVKVKDDPQLDNRVNAPNQGKISDLQLTSRLYSYLSFAQFDESHGFNTSNPAYGGWGLDVAKEDGNPGHMDLAHTRRALEAIRALMPNQRYPQFTRGELFLRVVQRDQGALASLPRAHQVLYDLVDIPFDGGFYFSPVIDQANKGRFASSHEGKSAPHFRSYATATCDGVLALLACGVSRNDERVTKAIEWLRAHEDFDYPEGIPRDHPEPWGDAIRFYHYAVRAEAYAALNVPGQWREKLAAAVAKQQNAGGSFRNEASPLMKEDDPVLCTGLAVVALAHCAK